jgi:chemotaxis methyl-accepting protein methylase
MSDVTTHDEGSLEALAAKIARDRGFAASNYKDTCLRRRIAVRMRANGVHDYAQYAALLDARADEYDKLLDALTINVTRLFRNSEAWEAVQRVVWPALFAGTGPVTVWSAGCATGEEPMTIVMSALSSGDGASRAADRLVVHATDIDPRALARARAGVFPEGAFAETPVAWRERWFTGEPRDTATPALLAPIRFAQRDLLQDPPPATGLQLVVCRNVMIYFDREPQDQLLRTFHDALAPGGFLLLGKVESLLGPARALFEVVDSRERLFRRAA